MKITVNHALAAKKRPYCPARVETLELQSSGLMIPGSPPLDPAPARHWVPGPGASYQPPAKIV